MIEILLYNVLFWSVYMYVCSLPYRLLQKAIDST